MSNALVPAQPEPQAPESHLEVLTKYTSQEAREFTIATQDQAQIAAELWNDARRRAKELEDAERAMCEDFVKGLDKIRARFAPLRKLAAQACDLWKGKIQESERRRKEETTKALQAAQTARAAGDQPGVAAAIQRIQPVEKLAGVQKRKIWKYRITDESKIPREYLQVNKAALQGLVAQHPEIPGVEFYQEEILAAG